MLKEYLCAGSLTNYVFVCHNDDKEGYSEYGISPYHSVLNAYDNEDKQLKRMYFMIKVMLETRSCGTEC